ncbi:MAG: hypothetical protein IJJ26_04710 [Victivallales bacterium]|nr:hypothetical protein [Victivallales bacterium]
MSEKGQDRSSRPLFDGNLRKENVQEQERNWSNEVSQRWKRSLVYVIPAVILLVALWLGLAHHFHTFPFPDEWELALEKEKNAPPPVTVKIEKGNENAKLKIVVLYKVDGKIPEQIKKIIEEAFDTKPSEIHYTYRSVTEEQSDRGELEPLEMSHDDEISIWINEKCNFDYLGHDVDLLNPILSNVSERRIKQVINQEYAKVYGKNRPPVFDLNAPENAPKNEIEIEEDKPVPPPPPKEELHLQLPGMDIRSK